MVLQFQLLCPASLFYSSSLQIFASNLNSSLFPYGGFKSASFKLPNSSAHMNKNNRRICAESRRAPFNKEAYEVERLRLDARAREAMKAQEQTEKEDNSKAWKWEIRKRLWDLMERENIAQNPRPVHHRIPNFVGAAAAAQLMAAWRGNLLLKVATCLQLETWRGGVIFALCTREPMVLIHRCQLASLEAFATGQCVKVNPDTPQKQVRYLTLSGGKKLLTPQPRLRTGFFSILDSTTLPRGAIHEACTSAGVAKHGRPIGLDAKIKVDLIVIGSVAVDPRTGARLGKGEGFAELEYGMLRYMGAIDDSTLIVTSVHDKQLVEGIPVEKLLIHDVPVDVICTPTQIIHTNTTIPKPQGIYWDRLSPEKLGQIKILRELKKRIEEETGQPLPCGPSEKLPPTAERSRRQG